MASRKNSDYDEVERRLRAATLLAGITWGDLAERIGEPGNFGETTLRKLNADSPPTKIRSAYRRTADATGLPAAFFTAPLEELGPTGGDQPSALLERLQQIELRLATLEAEREANAPSVAGSSAIRPSRSAPQL